MLAQWVELKAKIDNNLLKLTEKREKVLQKTMTDEQEEQRNVKWKKKFEERRRDSKRKNKKNTEGKKIKKTRRIL